MVALARRRVVGAALPLTLTPVHRVFEAQRPRPDRQIVIRPRHAQSRHSRRDGRRSVENDGDRVNLPCLPVLVAGLRFDNDRGRDVPDLRQGREANRDRDGAGTEGGRGRPMPSPKPGKSDVIVDAANAG